jgi:hypothetical protein
VNKCAVLIQWVHLLAHCQCLTLWLLPTASDCLLPTSAPLQETSDSMLALYLSTITKGIASINDVVDKVQLAYDRPGAGSGGGPPHHGGAIMGPGMGISRRRGAMGAMGQMMGL